MTENATELSAADLAARVSVTRTLTVSVNASRWAANHAVPARDLAAAESDLGVYVDEAAHFLGARMLPAVGDSFGQVKFGPALDEHALMLRVRTELAAALHVSDLRDVEGEPPSFAELLTYAATLVPREVHVVQRDNLDGLYGFVDEGQADEYAALFEGAERGTLLVNDERAGAEIIADERAELAENAEVLRWVCEDNARPLGYDVDDYRGGRWVLETGDDAEGWIMDLPDAPISAEAVGPWLLERYRVTLGKPLPADYGTAFAVEAGE